MPVYALVDGNSFYVSCQLAFQPALQNRPVVVLSNNDGCIVAANKAAKNLEKRFLKQPNYGTGGYRSARHDSMMFQPYFKVAPLLKKHNAVVFSSNYELYADMSQRMHKITAQFAQHQEIYSIDESFLDLSFIPKQQRTQHAKKLKNTVMQWIGIPVAVGIGSTKTQAKLANHMAKELDSFQGVLDLSSLREEALNALYKQVQVKHIWGVGKQLSKKLVSAGFHTAYDLKTADVKAMRKRFSINIEHTIRELRGEACFNLRQNPRNKQSIVSSRSFGQLVTSFQDMREAVSSYTATAAEKLREQNSSCQTITVSIYTPRYQRNVQQYQNQCCLPLIYPTDNTILLTKMALRALKQIWREGYQYQKACVQLSSIQDKEAFQVDLFAPKPKYSGNSKADKLMLTLDQINRQAGKKAVTLASCGLQQNKWQMNRKLMSPRYTTRWDDLPTANCHY